MPRRSKTSNPYMASSTLSTRQCEKLVEAFVMLLSVRGAAKYVGVSVATADRFFNLLMERLNEMGVFELVFAYDELFGFDANRSEIAWVEAQLRSHRGFDNEQSKQMYRVRYMWSHLMILYHKPIVAAANDERGFRSTVGVIKRMICNIIKKTGPLNRAPSEAAIIAARDRYFDDMTRKLSNFGSL